MSFKGAVAQAFDQAAPRYREQAHIQRQVSRRLMRRVTDAAVGDTPRILEVGCGVGFLSGQLRARWPGAFLLCSDISPAMVASCRQDLPQGGAFIAMDGERTAVGGGFDLVISSMVAQWFSQPQVSLPGLAALVRPGGIMAFATLGPETFWQWRRACQQVGLPCPTPCYADAQTLSSWLAPSGACSITEALLEEEITSPMAFFQGLRTIGATRALGGPTLPPGKLRRALAAMSGREITWQVLLGVVNR